MLTGIISTSLDLKSNILEGRNTASAQFLLICCGFQEEELFLEMLDHLAGEGDRDALDIFASRLATMACKAAVKGNHSMSKEEAEKFVDELLTLDNPYHCPHGKPLFL